MIEEMYVHHVYSREYYDDCHSSNSNTRVCNIYLKLI